MSKKGKRASGKKPVPSKRPKVLLESDAGNGSICHFSRRDGRNHDSLRRYRRKGPVLRVNYSTENPHLGRWKGFPVIDIHTEAGKTNLSLRKHRKFVLKMINACKKDGHEVILFVHGQSRPRGWKSFLISNYPCGPFKLGKRRIHPGITMVYLCEESQWYSSPETTKVLQN